MDKSQAHAFVHFLLAFRESLMESSRFVGKLRTKARYTLLLLFLARWLAGSVGSSHFVGELRTKARYTLLLLFLAPVRGLDGIVSLCGKVKNKSQVHAFTSFLSSEPTGGHSSSDFAMPPYGWLADPAREAELGSCEASTDFDPACASVEEAFAKIT